MKRNVTLKAHGKGVTGDANMALQGVLSKRESATLDGQRKCFREN